MSDLLPLQADDVAGRRRRSRRPLRRTGALLVVLLLTALVSGVFLGGRTLVAQFAAFGATPAADYAGPGAGSVLVQVRDGDTATDIARTLRDKDVVQSTGAFSSAAAADPASRSIQPGFYRLRAKMSADGALGVLVDPAARIVSRVTLPEGSTLAESVALTAKGVKVPAAQLQAALARPGPLDLPSYSGGKAEGFLFPATYEIEPGTSAAATLKQMVDRYRAAADDLRLEERAAAIGRTPYEVLITASLIEEETAFAGDRSKVARVVYNRLDAGMKLQFDSTVNYFLPQRKGRLLIDDTLVPNPYNTYLNTGLPPTPVGSPGEAALEAALAPAPGDFLYFITISKDGRSLFTSDYDEFVNAKKKSQAEGVY